MVFLKIGVPPMTSRTPPFIIIYHHISPYQLRLFNRQNSNKIAHNSENCVAGVCSEMHPTCPLNVLHNDSHRRGRNDIDRRIKGIQYAGNEKSHVNSGQNGGSNGKISINGWIFQHAKFDCWRVSLDRLL